LFKKLSESQLSKEEENITRLRAKKYFKERAWQAYQEMRKELEQPESMAWRNFTTALASIFATFLLGSLISYLSIGAGGPIYALMQQTQINPLIGSSIIILFIPLTYFFAGLAFFLWPSSQNTSRTYNQQIRAPSLIFHRANQAVNFYLNDIETLNVNEFKAAQAKLLSRKKSIAASVFKVSGSLISISLFVGAIFLKKALEVKILSGALSFFFTLFSILSIYIQNKEGKFSKPEYAQVQKNAKNQTQPEIMNRQSKLLKSENFPENKAQEKSKIQSKQSKEKESQLDKKGTVSLSQGK